MAKEYIEKKAFIRSIEGNPFTTDSVKSYIRCSVKAFPAADVRENVRGEWVYDEYGYAHCPECGYEHDEPEYVTPFCPNCGADMRGERND